MASARLVLQSGEDLHAYISKITKKVKTVEVAIPIIKHPTILDSE